MKQHHILITPGDGIGPEVMTEVKKIISFLNTEHLTNITITERPIGGGLPMTSMVYLSPMKRLISREKPTVFCWGLLGGLNGMAWSTVFALRPGF